MWQSPGIGAALAARHELLKRGLEGYVFIVPGIEQVREMRHDFDSVTVGDLPTDVNAVIAKMLPPPSHRR